MYRFFFFCTKLIQLKTNTAFLSFLSTHRYGRADAIYVQATFPVRSVLFLLSTIAYLRFHSSASYFISFETTFLNDPGNIYIMIIVFEIYFKMSVDQVSNTSIIFTYVINLMPARVNLTANVNYFDVLSKLILFI